MSTLAPARTQAQAEALRQEAQRSDRVRRGAWYVLAYVVLIGAAAVAIVPFLYLLSLSFKESHSLVEYPPQWIPSPMYYGNYTLAIGQSLFPRWFLNTLFVATSVTVLKLLFDSMSGYAFAKIDFPLKEPLFFVALATLMIPVVTTLVPLYLLVRNMGLQNTYPGLILPGLASPFGIFMMRQFMEQLPRDLENAARLDGASEPYIFFRVIVPLCKPALVALGIFTFMTQWSALVWPMVITTEEEMRLLNNALRALKGEFRTNWGLVAASMVLVIVPTMVAFVLFMRQFIAGSLAGALKQ